MEHLPVALDLMEALNAEGCDIYYTTGGFVGELEKYKGRTRGNCVEQNSVFFDIDAKDQLIQTPEVCLKELQRFVVAAGMVPPTSVVHTGGGIQAYWVFSAPITLDQWQVCATTLKQAAIAHGLKADLQCTIDRTRILRVPGFINWKRGVAAKMLYPAEGTAAIQWTYDEVFSPIAKHQLPVIPTRTREEANPYAGMVPVARLTQQSAFAGIEVADVRPQWLKIHNASTRGDGCVAVQCAVYDPTLIRYSIWTNMLSIAAHTDDVDAGVLAVSAGRDTYVDHGAAVQKAMSFDGPARCETIRAAFVADVQFDPCAGCKHFGKVNSPITLGYPDKKLPNEPTVVPTIIPANVAALAPSPTDAPKPTVTIAPLPNGFHVRPNHNGIWLRVKSDEVEGEYDWEMLMREDIRIVGVSQQGKVEGDQQLRYKFGYTHPRQGPQVFTLCPADLKGAAEGMWVSMSNAFVAMAEFTNPLRRQIVSKFIQALITQCADSTLATETVDRFGPRDDTDSTFVLGDWRYHPNGHKEQVILTPEAEKLARRMPVPAISSAAITHRANVISEWNRHLEDTIGDSLVFSPDQFVLASGFATALAPYIVPSRVRGGMIVVNSNAAGSGKSTMVERATQIYCNGDGTMVAKNTTQMAFLEQRVQVANALPVCWDELVKQNNDKSAELIQNLALCSTDRQQRERLTQGVARGGWQSWLYATQNPDPHSLVAANSSAAGGALHRILSVKLPSDRFGHGATLVTRQRAALQFEKWCQVNGGHVGAAWVEHFLPQVDRLRASYDRWTEILQEHAPSAFTGSGERFAVAIVTATLVAAEAAAAAGLHPFKQQALLAYAIELLAQSTETAQEHVLTEAAMIPQLMQTSLDVLLVRSAVNAGLNDRIPLREIGIRVDTDQYGEGTVHVTDSYLKRWAQKQGLDPARVRRAIIAEGKGLRVDADLTQGTPIPFGGMTKCFRMNARMVALPTPIPSIGGAHV